MKALIVTLIMAASSFSSPEQRIEEMENVIAILDHKMTDDELFDSLKMDIPKKNRSLPNQKEIEKSLTENKIAVFIAAALVIGVFGSIIQK